jgi:hypothetical protein
LKTHGWLARAIAFLDAVEISPGRYVYRDTHRYYVATGSQLARLGQYLEAQIRQRANPAIAVPGGGGYSEWGADTTTFDMPVWWTPAVGLEALATTLPSGNDRTAERRKAQSNDRTAEREQAENLIRWVKERHAFEPTTALVAHLKLPRDFDHCMMIDAIRYDTAKSAHDAALTLAGEITDMSVLERANEPQVPPRRRRPRH